MSLPKHVPDEHTDAMWELTERLGRLEFERRLTKEDQIRKARGDGHSRGIFRWQHLLDFYGIIRLSLKCCGLWERALRNYLDVQLVQQHWRFENLPKAFDGYRILQLTDLHADLHPDFPDSVIRAMNRVEYDLLVVTGDFRTCTYGDHSGANTASIKILQHANAPVYAILGNHDFLCKVPELENAGVRFLLNEHAVIEREGEALYLVGIDDPNFYKTHNFKRALKGVPAESFRVLLSHSPETYREAVDFCIDFLLAGHTHGGQLCLPGGHVLVHDSSSPRRLLLGPWLEETLQGYTSRGTGATGLPVRLNCPSEITLHTLYSSG
ncbi:MAG: metallophosphoesterase [Coraliomargarita sp.]